MSSLLESFGSAAKSFEDSLFARLGSVNDACTPQDAGRAEGFRSFGDDSNTDYERRHGVREPTALATELAPDRGFGRVEEHTDEWRKGYGQVPPRQQQHGDRHLPPQQQIGHRQVPPPQGQPPARPSLPEPRRPSLPPPRGAPRSATVAESFNAAPHRVQCALNGAAFSVPGATVSNSPPAPPAAAAHVVRPAEPTFSAAAGPVLDIFEQPESAAAPIAGGTFWDGFAPAPAQNRPTAPAKPEPALAALTAQDGADWAAVLASSAGTFAAPSASLHASTPAPSAADAVRRQTQAGMPAGGRAAMQAEVQAAAAREDYAEAARLQAELRRLEISIEIDEVRPGASANASAPVARGPVAAAHESPETWHTAGGFDIGGLERGGVDAIDESEML